MKTIDEIITSIYAQKQIEAPILFISDIIRGAQIKEEMLNPKIKQTEEYIGTGYSYIDVPEQTRFEILFYPQDLSKFERVQAVLKYVTVSKGRKTTFLPEGYSGICLLDFPKGKPAALNKLTDFNKKRDPNKHQSFYLSTQDAFDKIVELYHNEID